MALTLLFMAALSGCDNFDNPLRWDASPIADDLIGTWKAVEGPDAGVRARVSRMDDGGLGFELTFPENTKSTVRSNRDKHRATFLGDVLASGSMHILQVRLESYDEFDNDGESLWDSASGYVFQRISPAPDNGLHLQRLNLDAMGKVAEEEIADSGFKIEVNAFAGCLSEDIGDSLWIEIWSDMREKLGDELRIKVQDALELGQQEVADIERESARFAELKVDPYAELANIRNCVALRLPSESLERIFLLHTDLVFSGGIDRYIHE